MARAALRRVHEPVEDEEYWQVLTSIERALAICENSQTADDVIRLRLRGQLRKLRLGLLCLLEPAASGQA